ncbi:hypothetical protein [Ensifer sesbaniae]|uniref:hypothetical protein n=1 Tax=Ensifer sesbaniae TaxID=1214071 RepID=UPI00156838F5|nr:hypothetical protein [Ensifer sesbaniae]NRQ19197.1 hypothetical protein [Ensifer sesbaniae]
MAAVEAAVKAPLLDVYNKGTTVHAALAKLTLDTAVAVLPSKRNLRSWCDLT